MKITKSLLFILVLMIALSSGAFEFFSSVDAKENKESETIPIPELTLSPDQNVALISTNQPIGATIYNMSITAISSKTLFFMFNNSDQVKTATVKVYHRNRPFDVTYKADQTKVSLRDISTRRYGRAIRCFLTSKNCLENLPIQISFHSKTETLSFYWWSNKGVTEPFVQAVVMQQNDQCYLFDRYRKVWLLAHPDTIKRFKDMHTLAYTYHVEQSRD